MKTKERGITLIALVVTIIVLLILAGVSIQMLAGQSGILKNAQQAREETEKGQIRDDVRREIMEKMTENKGDVSSTDLYEILNKYFDLAKSGEGQNEEVKAPDQYGEETNPWEAEDFPENFPELHSKEGNYSFKLGDLYSGTLSGAGTTGSKAGEIVPIPADKQGKWNADSVNPTLDEKGNVIPVPKDFHYVEGAENGTDEEKDNIGVVIADDEGNEFVWVPVPKAVADAETSKKIEAKTQVDLTKTDLTPMAELVDGKYRGVLYDEDTYTISNSSKTVKYRAYPTDTSVGNSYREPDTVTGPGTAYDASSRNFQIIETILGDQTNYKSEDTFKTIMQADYNAIVDRVATYGGFYVARYEMSLTDWQEQEGKKKAQFIKGATSATAETPKKNEENGANEWYGLYAYNKQFATANGYSSVKSSMIWGSQYDAMMNWMARSGIDVASKTIEGKSKNTTSITGKGNTGEDNSTDVLNNIYDLLGNRMEWTLEAFYTQDRTLRGGNGSALNDMSPSHRGYNVPTWSVANYSARASLYIL